jgi:hypothetical protein
VFYSTGLPLAAGQTCFVLRITYVCPDHSGRLFSVALVVYAPGRPPGVRLDCLSPDERQGLRVAPELNLAIRSFSSLIAGGEDGAGTQAASSKVSSPLVFFSVMSCSLRILGIDQCRTFALFYSSDFNCSWLFMCPLPRPPMFSSAQLTTAGQSLAQSTGASSGSRLSSDSASASQKRFPPSYRRRSSKLI